MASPTAEEARPAFRDSATDCAICLSSLSEQRVLTLSCGHIYHLRCLREQLHHARPSPSRRLLFSGTYCAKCSAPCEHPLLAADTTPLAALRDRVDALILRQAAVDGLAPTPAEPDLLALGRRFYAFYLCALCSEPYFGGTAACADSPVDDQPASDRTCPRCSPRVGAACAVPEHTGLRVWKCRFCCAVARFLCRGGTHFCPACHARHVALRPGERQEAIPCPGEGVCAALRPGEAPHANGPGPECERVLACAACATDDAATAALPAAERGSPNMLYNGDAQHDMRGWHVVSCGRPGDRWTTETSDVPFRASARNFVSSHSWCAMASVVPLARFARRPGEVFIEASARYMARLDCPSVFRMEAALLDGHGRELKAFDSGELDAPDDYWDMVRAVFEPAADARFLVLGVLGKDRKFWAGEYGAKVTGCCVRVLYDDAVRDEGEVVFESAFEDISEERDIYAQRALLEFCERREHLREPFIPLRFSPDLRWRML